MFRSVENRKKQIIKDGKKRERDISLQIRSIETMIKKNTLESEDTLAKAK